MMLDDLHPSLQLFFSGTGPTGNAATRGDAGGTCHEHVEGVDLKGNPQGWKMKDDDT